VKVGCKGKGGEGRMEERANERKRERKREMKQIDK
jgi:hypothetical protein